MNESKYSMNGEDELTDLFGDEVKGQNAELERVKRAAAEKAYHYVPSTRPKKKETQPAPNISEFSDGARYSMNRLNPGIQLTSVEQEYRNGHQGQSASELMAKNQNSGDTTGFIPEEVITGAYSAPSYAAEPVVTPAAAPAVSPAAASAASPARPAASPAPSRASDVADTAYHGKYDYDYDAEESGYVYQGSVPVEAVKAEGYLTNDQKLQAALEAERRASEAIEAKEQEEREAREKKEKLQRTITVAVMGVVALLMIIAIILLLIPGGSDTKAEESSSVSSVVLQKDQQTYSGIITQLDATHGTLLVYNADQKGEKSFSTSGSSVSLSALKIGDMVDVVYDVANKDTLISIMSCAKAEIFKDVTGISVSGTQISLGGKLYSMDSRLICEYNGTSYNKENITSSTVFDASTYNGHCYKIEIVTVPSSVTIENLGEYSGGTVTITPAEGESMTKNITLDSLTVEVPEGSVTITVTKDHKEVYSGVIFATASSENKITIPDKDRETGTVVFQCELPSTVSVTVTIDGKDYVVGSGITMEYGTYRGTAKASGYKDATVQFTLDSAYKTVKIEMIEAKAYITFSANVSGYTVWVDGAYAAYFEGTGGTIQLKEGAHWIVCTKDGYNDQGVSIVVGSDVASQTVTLGGFAKLPEESSEESSENSSETSSGNNSENSSNNSSGNNSENSSNNSSESSSENSTGESSTGSSESSSESSPESSSEAQSESSEQSSSDSE